MSREFIQVRERGKEHPLYLRWSLIVSIEDRKEGRITTFVVRMMGGEFYYIEDKSSIELIQKRLSEI